MRTKTWPNDDPRTAELLSFWEQMPRENPALYGMAVAADDYAQWRFDRELIITSIWRITNDPNRLHRNWQAIDWRVHNDMRDGPIPETLTLSEWVHLQEWLNTTFRYGKLNRLPWKSGQVLKLRVKWEAGGRILSPQTHAHMQERGRRFWK